MHILFVSDNFFPESNAPARRTFEHCKIWVSSGHHVTVITCAPNFPGGKVFDGYRNKLWQTEVIDGVRVVRVWSYITANEGFLKRILDYISFMTSACVAGAFVRNVDIIVGTSPQFFTSCAAYLLACVKRVPWIFELRDLWPESIQTVGAMKNSWMLDKLELLELFLYRKATRIVAVTEAFRRNLSERGIDIRKIDVITNGVSLDNFTPREKDNELVAKYGLQGKFAAGYIGTLGMAHSLETILEAAAMARQEPVSDKYQFMLIGSGANQKNLEGQVKERGLTNVTITGPVPGTEIIRYWSILDAAIVHLKNTPEFRNVIPSKIFESMAMAIPIVHAVEGESADIVASSEAGILAEPESAVAMLDSLKLMSENKPLYLKLKSNGPKAAATYDRKILALEMLQVLESVVAANGR